VVWPPSPDDTDEENDAELVVPDVPPEYVAEGYRPPRPLPLLLLQPPTGSHRAATGRGGRGLSFIDPPPPENCITICAVGWRLLSPTACHETPQFFPRPLWCRLTRQLRAAECPSFAHRLSHSHSRRRRIPCHLHRYIYLISGTKLTFSHVLHLPSYFAPFLLFNRFTGGF